jgi:BirA family transcriptional regulator, biotin operon repressor / biotin---[acetyl-CoA-carboxylase] ligase
VAEPGSPLTSARFGQLAAVLPDCPSTQDIVRAAARSHAPEGFVVVTDHQTAGRGRRGRTWVDQPGQCVLFSLLLRPATAPDAVAPITLVAAIAVAEALAVNARIRWPNDVVVGGAKIAGVLAELELVEGRDPVVVLGVGINTNVPPEALPETDRLAATSLMVETGVVTDRLGLLLRVVDRLQAAYREFEALGFAALFDRYAALDDLSGRVVTVLVGDEQVDGVAAGVDAAGRLCIRCEGGSQRMLDAGEVIRVV